MATTMKKFERNNRYKGVKFGDIITITERTNGMIIYKDNCGRYGNSVVLIDKHGNESANIFNNMDVINA